MEVVDDDFLSLVEAAEAAAKKRKVDSAASAGHLEGSYTAALKGSKSLSWQQQTASDAASKPKTTRPSDAIDGNSCFKCGKPGHWARDCAGVGVPHDGSRNPASSAAAVEEKPCSCGAGPCLVLTASTERNRGRKFYRCPVREENGGCGFFEWCDNPSSVPNNNQTSSVVLVPDLPCPCGAGACKVLTAKTEKNMGQQFYRCPANQGESCGFFKWCSEHNPIVSPPTSGKRANSSTFNGVSSQPYGGGSSCFKCGEEGHWARDCPKPSTDSYVVGGGRSDSSNACYKCGKTGHWAKDCPSQEVSDAYGGGSSCFKCGEEGHWARDCPKPSTDSYVVGGGRSDSSSACYKCGKTGHWAKDCPSQEVNVITGSGKTTSVRSSRSYHCK